MTREQALILNARLSGDTDEAKLSNLNAAKTAQRERLVYIGTFGKLFGLDRQAQIETALEGIAANAADETTRLRCKTILSMLHSLGIDVGLPESQQLIPSFVPSVLTQAEADTLLAEGITVTASDAVEVLGREAVADDLTEIAAWAERTAKVDTFNARYTQAMDLYNASLASLSSPLPSDETINGIMSGN